MTNNTRRGFLRSILAAIIGNRTKAGTRFWVKKTLTSSACLASAATAITGTATGQLALLDVITKTDSTGLATGTNFQLLSDNAKGLPVFFSTAISGLGASKSIDLTNASVTKIKTVIESGKTVKQQNTVADSTGSGTIDVWMLFERIDDDATIAAA